MTPTFYHTLIKAVSCGHLIATVKDIKVHEPGPFGHETWSVLS